MEAFGPRRLPLNAFDETEKALTSGAEGTSVEGRCRADKVLRQEINRQEKGRISVGEGRLGIGKERKKK